MTKAKKTTPTKSTRKKMPVGIRLVKGHTINKGKKNAQKLNTPELKKLAYESYLEHLAAGKVKKSWFFEHKDLTLTWESIENYIKSDPLNFPPQKKAAAWAKGYQHWESVVGASAGGTNKDANTATLQMLMRNKYGWDKQDSNASSDSITLLSQLLEHWKK